MYICNGIAFKYLVDYVKYNGCTNLKNIERILRQLLKIQLVKIVYGFLASLCKSYINKCNIYLCKALGKRIADA